MKSATVIASHILLIFSMLILYGCNSDLVTERPETIQTRMIPSTMTILQTSTWTPEEPTSTKTSSPSRTPISTHTLTPTPSTTPTLKPVPTLSPDTKYNNLLELFSTNGGCDFPCWWGIELGEPTTEVFDLAFLLGKNPTVRGTSYSYNLSLDELSILDLTVDFTEENQIVQKINVILSKPSRLNDFLETINDGLSLHSIFTKYHQPTGILLRVTPRAEKDTPIMYSLRIIYEQNGFAMGYEGIVTAEESIQICPKPDDFHLEYISLYFQDARAMNDLQSNSLAGNSIAAPYQFIENATSMTLDDFFQVFSSSNDEKICFTTSLELWR